MAVGGAAMAQSTAAVVQKRDIKLDYDFANQIGSGSFAVVWRATRRADAATVAIKEIATEKLNKKLRESLESEIAILQRTKHPNIIRLHELRRTEGKVFLVMEYCGGGDLAHYIRQNGPVTEATARTFMGQLGAGLKVLRAHNLIHRDLKPQNLLLTTQDANSAVLKIADFGFARSMQPQDLAETLCGSPLYMAPEILQFQKYDAKADLWSVGTILFELVTGRPPFGGANHVQLLRNIERKEAKVPEKVAMALSPECLKLVANLLRRNPVERLSFEEFFSHPFMVASGHSSAGRGGADGCGGAGGERARERPSASGAAAAAGERSSSHSGAGAASSHSGAGGSGSGDTRRAARNPPAAALHVGTGGAGGTGTDRTGVSGNSGGRSAHTDTEDSLPFMLDVEPTSPARPGTELSPRYSNAGRSHQPRAPPHSNRGLQMASGTSLGVQAQTKPHVGPSASFAAMQQAGGLQGVHHQAGAFVSRSAPTRRPMQQLTDAMANMSRTQAANSCDSLEEEDYVMIDYGNTPSAMPRDKSMKNLSEHKALQSAEPKPPSTLGMRMATPSGAFKPPPHTTGGQLYSTSAHAARAHSQPPAGAPALPTTPVLPDVDLFAAAEEAGLPRELAKADVPPTNPLVHVAALECCAALLAEVSEGHSAEGRHASALSVQLLVLECLQLALGFAQKARREDTDPFSANMLKLDPTTDSSLSARVKRKFIDAVERAEAIEMDIDKDDDEEIEAMRVPDAIELTFQAAMNLGRAGAADELISNFEDGAAAYAKASALLYFLLVEAPLIRMTPPLSLRAMDKLRLRRYAFGVGARYAVCSESGRSSSSNLGSYGNFTALGRCNADHLMESIAFL